jgi:ribonuclease Z
MRLTFLGTAAARPTVGRNVSSLLVQREGDVMMFDCGEGTQRQMMRYGTGFSFGDIFFTHLHADHFLGVIGLLRTLGLQAREEPMDLWTPRGTEPILKAAVELGVERVPFEVRINGVEPGDRVAREGYDVVPFRVAHAGKAFGWAVWDMGTPVRIGPRREPRRGLRSWPRRRPGPPRAAPRRASARRWCW